MGWIPLLCYNPEMQNSVIFRIVTVTLCCVLTLSTSSHAQAPSEPKVAPPPAKKPLLSDKPLPVPGVEEEKDKGPKVITITPEMEVAVLVSQLMMVTMEGKLGPNRQDVALLTKFTPGAVLVQGIESPVAAADYVTSLRELPMESKAGIAMLIGTDLFSVKPHESMKGTLMTEIPSLLSLAAVNDPTAAEIFAGMVADQLLTMGFNFHLGPSLELAPTSGDAKGTIYSLGSNPQFVSETSATISRALLERGIISVPLGFPGGGGNRAPREPAVLLTPKSTLAQEDMYPYAQAIKNGAKIIHVGNTLVPTIDPNAPPASISKAVITGLLRDTLKYEGIVVAGPMDSIDIVNRMDPTEAAVTALEAGADMVWWNKADQRILNTIDAIVRAVMDGRIPRENIQKSYDKILALKKDNGLLERPHPDMKAAERMLNDDVQPEIAADLSRRSITLVRNRGDLLPLKEEGSAPLGLTATVEGLDELLEILQKEKIRPVLRQRIVSAKYDGEIHDFDINRIVKKFAGAKSVVCVFTSQDRPQAIREVIMAIRKQGSNVIAVLLGYPSNLASLSYADAILVAYCGPTEFAQNIDTFAEVLLGNAPVSIRPMSREIRTKVGEIELYRAIDVIHSPCGRLPVTINEEFTAGMSVGYNVEAYVKKAEWLFGDGEKMKGLQVERAYAAPGTYPVTLTVTMRSGQVETGTFDVVVE